MAFTDATLAIICTSCAVPLWANGTKHFNPVRLVPFITTFFLLSRLWQEQYVHVSPAYILFEKSILTRLGH